MCFSLWPWVAWSFTAVMSLYRASLNLSVYVSLVLHRILVSERACVLSHVALCLRQNRGTYWSTRRMVTFFFFRRLGQDMFVSSSPWHPTAGSQRLYRKMQSFHGSLTAREFSHFYITSEESVRVSTTRFRFCFDLNTWHYFVDLFWVQRPWLGIA